MELSEIQEGMGVYDKDGARIGTVETVRLGKGTEKTDVTDIVTIVETLSEAIGGRKDLPVVLYSRAFDEGFVRVNRGLLRRDAIVFPNQIESVGEESLYLLIEASELTKL